MKIKTACDFRRAFRSGPYAWPGGYPLFFITADGAALSFEAAQECRHEILQAIGHDDARSGWRIVAVEINYEDGELTCAHTGKPIPSAYGPD